jgi:hypothetical protein
VPVTGELDNETHGLSCSAFATKNPLPRMALRHSH